MTQFVLIEGLTTRFLPEWIEAIPITGDDFLMAAGEEIFRPRSPADIVTVRIDGKDIDQVVLEAHEEISQGRCLEKTRLHEFLLILLTISDRFALWYGSDYSGLNLSRNPEQLIKFISDGLKSPSIEVYTLFAP